jgi:pimeloyl-ACP methyl ester carboxylesterase
MRVVDATRSARKSVLTRCTEQVITVGGSYPGFLSAMMRLRYPAVVDMAYSASAPTLLYAQLIEHTAYYQKITESAERAVSGCPAAVRRAFASYLSLGSKEATVSGLGLCTDPSAMPAYIAAGDVGTLRLAVRPLPSTVGVLRSSGRPIACTVVRAG